MSHPSRLSGRLLNGRYRTALASGWRPSAAGLLFAAASGVNVLVQYPAFRAHHRSAGSVMADWNACWRVWCRDVATAAAVRRRTAGAAA
jgi:hypothetical protein